MSGISGLETCPNCGGKETLETYSDWKPFEHVSGECYECGFFYYTVAEQMSLRILNRERKERGMDPLKKLPKILKLMKSYIQKKGDINHEERNS